MRYVQEGWIYLAQWQPIFNLEIHFMFYKITDSCWRSENLLASQEWIYYMEMVRR